MATVNASVVSAFNADGQNFYTIEYPGTNLFPNRIAGVSKADPAVVTVPSVAKVISTTGTIGTVTGSGTTNAPWSATITNMTTTTGLQSGQIITATAGTGSFSANGEVSVYTVAGNQSIVLHKIGGTAPTAGTVTNISIPAVSSLPVELVDGSPILITGVAGMTQLATAGADGTNLFYANVLSGTSFSLYTNSALSDTVDSSAFTTATANTGQYNTYTGAQYVSSGSIVPVLFPTVDVTVGTDISIDAQTGEITLAGGQTYNITVTSFPLSNPASQGGTLQLYDNGAAAQIGPSHPIGSSFFGTVAPTVESVYQILAVAPNGAAWTPPAGIQHAEITITSVSGAAVA